MRRAAGLGLAGVLLAAGPVLAAGPGVAAPAGSGWSQIGYSAGRTSYNPDETVIDADGVGRLRERWSSDLDAGYELDWCSGPPFLLVSGGRVVTWRPAGIEALKVGTGATVWSVDLGAHRYAASAALAGGLVVAAVGHCLHPEEDPELIGIDLGTGRVAWRRALGAAVGDLTVDRGTILASPQADAAAARVLAFRASDGRQLWSVVGYRSLGVAGGGRLYASRHDPAGAVVGAAALSIATGEQVWGTGRRLTAGAASPDGQRLYAFDDQEHLLALRGADGTALWRIEHGPAALVVDDRTVHTGNRYVAEAFQASTGRRRWQRDLGDYAIPQAGAAGLLYVEVGRARTLVVLDTADGTDITLRDPVRVDGGGEPVVAGGRLYAVDRDRVLRSYQP